MPDLHVNQCGSWCWEEDRITACATGAFAYHSMHDYCAATTDTIVNGATSVADSSLREALAVLLASMFFMETRDDPVPAK